MKTGKLKPDQYRNKLFQSLMKTNCAMPYKILFSLFIFYAPFVSAKYQVCSITINSSDELNAFKAFLSPKDFDFVELLPFKINEKQDHSSHWFDEACKKDYKCDLLLISGHFGGTFFGKSGYALPTELLEEKACQNSCPSLLSNVKEIFLFGCNTLASKKKDSRSYTDYLKVLLDDGMARETAERVVAARYSPLGTPFVARMNFIFSESSTVYGFNELSYLGSRMRQPLKNYLQSINRNFGSYANYLKSGNYKRTRNKELFKSLPRASLNQAHASLSNENLEQRHFFHNKCLLYDSTASFDQRIQALKMIFDTKKAGSAFFAIDSFLASNKKEVTEGKGRQIFRSIRTNKFFAEEFLSYYRHLNFLPYIKLVYLNVLEKFQWIDPFDLKIRMKQDLLELIKTPDPEAYISLLLLLRDNQIKPGEFYISKKDLPENYIRNIWSLLIFEKLKAEAPDWQPDMLKYCENNINKEPALCYQVLNTLAHNNPSLKTAQTVVVFLDHANKALIYYTIRVLGQSEIKDYHVHKKISFFLTHEDPSIKLEALEALGFLRSPYTDIQNDITKLLSYADEKLALEIFWSLSRMNVQGETAQKNIIYYIVNNAGNKKLLKKAFKAFKNTSDLSDFSLDFFYQHLDSRENLAFVLDIVENLSRNTHLRDLGIHYRFLQFQEESSKVKQEALKRMAFLTWLHPETQIDFLNYIRDEDPIVRTLAINILRNIENLENKTLNKIKALYQEENIKELKVFF